VHISSTLQSVVFRDKSKKNIYISWLVTISTSTATLLPFSSNIPSTVDTFAYINTINFIYELVECIINVFFRLLTCLQAF
jgi:hypothetical protein